MEYNKVVGGSLKLKKVSSGRIAKKLSKNPPSKEYLNLHLPIPDLHSHLDRQTTRSLPSSSSSSNTDPRHTMTEAERKLLEIQRERRLKQVQQLARKSHKDKVSEFNSKLAKLSEHHDVPKVGPG